jgi:hypothetical protein
MNPLTKFEFKGRAVRSITKDGEPWFVAKDVCGTLGIQNTAQAVAALDEDEKGICQGDTLGGRQNLAIVSEPGLYRLIARSDKPQAKAFLRWVTHEVLPAIRKTGSYHGTPPIPTQDQMCEFALRRLAGINHPVHGFGTESKDGRLRIGYRGPTYTVTPGRLDDAAMVHASLDILANPLLPGLYLEGAK